jgi:hypothetical protein
MISEIIAYLALAGIILTLFAAVTAIVLSILHLKGTLK